MKLEKIGEKRRLQKELEAERRRFYSGQLGDDSEPQIFERKRNPEPEKEEPEPERVTYADGSGYVNYGGPGGPLYFDRNGNT